MAGLSGAVKWAGDNPVIVAVGVFAVGAVFILMNSKPAPAGNNGMAAFYAAQAASAQSGNQLAMVQAQVTGAQGIAKIQSERDQAIASTSGATALGLATTQGKSAAELAEIAGKYNVQTNTIQAQRDVNLANINRDVLLESERTRQMAQKQQFFLGVGQNQIQGASLPYLLSAIQQGGSGGANAMQVMLAQILGATKYNAAS
jgi:hypothetical protein